MAISLQHFIISRFNLGLFDKYEENIALEWMNYRLWLFDYFTYPSVVSQTNQNFVWIVLFDEKTPMLYRRIIKKYSRISPIYSKSTSVQDLAMKVVKRFIRPEVDYIITTRMDVDDMISKDFIQRVQFDMPKKDNFQLVFPLGYVFRLQDNVLMEREYLYNQFPSYIEKNSDNVKTVWFTQHNLLHKTAESKEGVRNRMWCWVLHDKNLCPASVPKNYLLPKVNVNLLQEQFVFNWRNYYEHFCNCRDRNQP